MDVPDSSEGLIGAGMVILGILHIESVSQKALGTHVGAEFFFLP